MCRERPARSCAREVTPDRVQRRPSRMAQWRLAHRGNGWLQTESKAAHQVAQGRAWKRILMLRISLRVCHQENGLSGTALSLFVFLRFSQHIQKSLLRIR